MPTKERRLGQVEESQEPREGLFFRSRVAIQLMIRPELNGAVIRLHKNEWRNAESFCGTVGLQARPACGSVGVQARPASD